MNFGEPPVGSQYQMHPTLWDSPTPLLLVFAVAGGETLYKLNVNELAKHCKIFEDIMNLPPPERKEGTTDNPIIIHGVTDKAFEGFIKWCRHIPWANSSGIISDDGPVHEDQLYDLLHLGDLWDSRSLMKFAIQRLERLPLSPCRKLGIAIRFRIRIWLDQVVCDILSIRPTGLTREDIENISSPVILYSIIKAREKIQAERALLALEPLALPYTKRSFCPADDHKNCIRITREIWFTRIGPALLQDLNLFDNSSVDFYMRSMQSAFKGVNVECFLEMCDSIRNERKLTNMATFVLEKLTAAIAAEIGPNPALEERFFTDSE
ncbi:hypothetical protein BKA70DRAFT_1451839 [Coprinopsis sp. MPI-PUGE-AT-0042]|nr:hypothetical protein BKA70DRAFT_1451839 [Coprinopsis sp. MPI-PUGE-AT-0042]